MSENQQQLVSLLYSVHDKLRLKKSLTKDDQEWEEAWREHTSDFKTLQEYSKAMHELATKVWQPRNSKTTGDGDQRVLSTCVDEKTVKLKCRLEWVVRCCADYFRNNFEGDTTRKLKLLDVGSCYNPFSKFANYFDIVAVDLCPAPGFENQIFQCDFLEVNVDARADSETCVITDSGDDSCEAGNYKIVTNLPRQTFEVVIFSYFLEYLADAKQREKSCRKAYDLLKNDGLLFILRPDSSKVTPGGNNVLIKKLKVGMGLLGFKRVYFEKLEHLWCMAFKKLNDEERSSYIQSSYFKKDAHKVGLQYPFDISDRIHELFCISQDFKHFEQPESAHCSGTSSSSSTVGFYCDQLLLEELPHFED